MNQSASRPLVGISQCLLGEPVRFDGGHKHSTLCTQQLNSLFDYLPLCPEAAIGLGTPRKPLRLQYTAAGELLALQPAENNRDVTAALVNYSDRIADHHGQTLSGYIFMAKSPSCGVFRSKIYNEDGHVMDHGPGIFAKRLGDHLPLLPVEEAGRLNDAVLRDAFIVRVQAYHRWQQLNTQGLSVKALTDYYASYKYQVMAHDPTNYNRIGKLLANPHQAPLESLAIQLLELLMASLQKTASRKQHTNVLMHIRGYFSRQLNKLQHLELSRLIEQYRLGHVPLIVPLTLIRHYLLLHPNDYLARQVYLQPYPDHLGIRNHL